MNAEVEMSLFVQERDSMRAGHFFSFVGIVLMAGPIWRMLLICTCTLDEITSRELHCPADVTWLYIDIALREICRL